MIGKTLTSALKCASPRLLMALLLMACLHVTPAMAQPQPPKDFVPVDETAPQDQIPALPLIAGAYGFIWMVTLGYVWSIGRRLQKVEGELAELEGRKK